MRPTSLLWLAVVTAAFGSPRAAAQIVTHPTPTCTPKIPLVPPTATPTTGHKGGGPVGKDDPACKKDDKVVNGERQYACLHLTCAGKCEMWAKDKTSPTTNPWKVADEGEYKPKPRNLDYYCVCK